MTGDDKELLARITLSRVAEPGDATVGRAVREQGAVAALRCMRDGQLGSERLQRVQAREAAVDAPGDLARYENLGARSVLPGSPEWPTQLDDLGDERPYVLWVRGSVDLRFSCLQSVSVVGSRASSAYGAHVASEMAAVLAERGWSSISGGAYGIDSAAHRGTLAVGGVTLAVLACGLDVCYPRGHQELFDRVRQEGALLSEWLPGTTPTRP